MARHYFGDDNPLGRRLTLENETAPYEIIGVAVDAKYADLRVSAPQTVYLLAFQTRSIFSQFALRTSVPPAGIVTQGTRHHDQ